MRLEAIALYRSDGMHGLRCDPALLGWTRVLDEWVVSLMVRDPDATSERIDWCEEGSGVATFAEAVTRVRSFAFREGGIEPTTPRDDGTLRVEVQGRVYRVAFEHQRPESPEALGPNVESELRRVAKRAARYAEEGELPIGALLLTPRFARGPDLSTRVRQIRCRGCAFSFPPRADGRYRHGSDGQPGALLLIESPDGPPEVWA